MEEKPAVKRARLQSATAWSPLEDLAVIEGVLKRIPFETLAQQGVFSRPVTAEDIESRWKVLLRMKSSKERFEGMGREAAGLLYGGYQEPLIDEVEEEVLRRELVVDKSAASMSKLMKEHRASFHYRRTPKTLSKHLKSMKKLGTYDRFSHPFATQMRNNVEQSDGASLTEPPDIQVLGPEESKPILNNDERPRRADIIACRELEVVDPILLTKDDLEGVAFHQIDIQSLAFADASLFAPVCDADKMRSICEEEQEKVDQMLQVEAGMRIKMSEAALARLYGERLDMEMTSTPLFLRQAELGRVEPVESAAEGVENVASIDRTGDNQYVLRNHSCKHASVNGCPIKQGKAMILNNLAYVEIELAAFIFETQK